MSAHPGDEVGDDVLEALRVRADDLYRRHVDVVHRVAPLVLGRRLGLGLGLGLGLALGSGLGSGSGLGLGFGFGLGLGSGLGLGLANPNLVLGRRLGDDRVAVLPEAVLLAPLARPPAEEDGRDRAAPGQG